MLETVTSYYCILFQEKVMNQTLENGKKLVFGLVFATLRPKFAPQEFLQEF